MKYVKKWAKMKKVLKFRLFCQIKSKKKFFFKKSLLEPLDIPWRNTQGNLQLLHIIYRQVIEIFVFSRNLKKKSIFLRICPENGKKMKFCQNWNWRANTSSFTPLSWYMAFSELVNSIYTEKYAENVMNNGIFYIGISYIWRKIPPKLWRRHFSASQCFLIL